MQKVQSNFGCVHYIEKQIQNSIQFVIVIIRDWGRVNICVYVSLKFISLFCFLKHHMVSFAPVMPLSDELLRVRGSRRVGHYCHGLSANDSSAWRTVLPPSSGLSFHPRGCLEVSLTHLPQMRGKPPPGCRSLLPALTACLVPFTSYSPTLKSRALTWRAAAAFRITLLCTQPLGAVAEPQPESMSPRLPC